MGMRRDRHPTTESRRRSQRRCKTRGARAAGDDADDGGRSFDELVARLRIGKAICTTSAHAVLPPLAIDERHPVVDGPTRPPFDRIWTATCRVLVPGGMGSGFCVGTAPETFVTCAHVVEGAPHIVVQRPLGGLLLEIMLARTVALDLANDLAVVEWDGAPATPVLADGSVSPRPPTALELADPPEPGESVYLAGFPNGTDTLRLSRGLVSGYTSAVIDGAEIFGVALDASVSGGNSGGPVCLADGRVAGVVFARESVLPDGLAIPPELRPIFERLNANNGIAMSLDVGAVRNMIEQRRALLARTRRRFDHYAESHRTLSISRANLLALHRVCKQHGLSPLGPFSFNASSGDVHHGWYGAEDRVLLDVPQSWKRVLRSATERSGGSVWMEGLRVWVYRQRYHGYIVGGDLHVEA